MNRFEILVAQFAEDPPDPNYKTVFQVPSSVFGITFQGGSAALNELADAHATELELAALYLYAANTALNRYASALAAGDVASAILQMEAFGQYEICMKLQFQPRTRTCS